MGPYNSLAEARTFDDYFNYYEISINPYSIALTMGQKIANVLNRQMNYETRTALDELESEADIAWAYLQSTIIDVQMANSAVATYEAGYDIRSFSFNFHYLDPS